MQYAGWLGTFFALSSSLMLSFGFIKKEHWFFSSSMLFASIIFLFSSFSIANYQAVMSNTFFTLSSILAIFGIIIKFKFISFKSMIVLLIATYFSSLVYYSYIGDVDWFIESIGWIPVITMPFTFLLFTQHKISIKNYFLMNIISHSIFFVHLTFVMNYPLAFLQFVCFFISLVGFSNNLLKKTEKNGIILKN